MADTNRTTALFTSANEAVAALFSDGLRQLVYASDTEAMDAYHEIAAAQTTAKSHRFYARLVPLRSSMIALFVDTYRKYFRVALANPGLIESHDPDAWAQTQLQPAIAIASEWLRDWYILVCDGVNQRVRLLGPAPFVSAETGSMSASIDISAVPFRSPISWRAPSWLFHVSLVAFGIGKMKQKHVPVRDSEERLGESHTRLLLKGARRVFLWQLADEIKRARNEEFAAAGAIRTETLPRAAEGDEQKASKARFSGFAGLGQKKDDLSRYVHKLTDKQQMAFSLKYEYELGLAEIASRMGVNRKTAYEHIQAANRKISQVRSNENRKARRSNAQED